MNETKRTLRERKFIDAYIKNNGNATEAYLAVNPEVKRKNASVYGVRMLEKVSIEVNELLDKLDLTDVCLGKKLKEGLEAVKKVSGFDVPDHNVRVKYLDMAFKLKNTYPAEKGKPEEEERKVIVIGAEEKGNTMDRLFFEINNLVEKRIEAGDKYQDKYKEIDDNGVDHRSEMQKLADRLIALGKGEQNDG
ncbi:hypothetical protein ES708_09820 [subsurface metagenome]